MGIFSKFSTNISYFTIIFHGYLGIIAKISVEKGSFPSIVMAGLNIKFSNLNSKPSMEKNTSIVSSRGSRLSA